MIHYKAAETRKQISSGMQSLLSRSISIHYLWPLTWKRSLRLAVFKRIAVRKPFISRSNGSSYLFKKISICSNGSSYPFKKISIRSNGSSYLFKKISIRLNGSSYPFKKISIRSNGSSYLFKKIRSHSNSLSCPFKSAVRTPWAIRWKNRQPLQRFELSHSKKFVNRKRQNSNCLCHFGSIVEGWVNWGCHNCSLMWKPFTEYRVCARDVIKFSNPKLKSH